MSQYVLTLIYADGTNFIVGGFSTMDALNTWLTTEQAKSYWVASTTTDIQTITIGPGL